MAESFPELRPAARILLGPGPSNVNPRVMKAMASPVVGHLDPDFLKVMENIKKLLRTVFRTKNEITFPVSGTGSAGMEAVMANLIEDGDEVVVGVNGAFGTRLAEVASRLGAKVHKVEAEWGTIVEPSKIATALKVAKNPKLVAVVHAETSTGIHQPIEEIAELAQRHGAMMAIDAVTSLGVRAGRDRQVGNRRLLQLHAEGYRCAARTVAGDVQRARDGIRAQAQNEMPIVVLRCRVDRAVLGAGPAVPSHGADHDELCAVRGPEDRCRGGIGSAMAAASRERVRVPGRSARDGYAARGAGRIQAAAAHDDRGAGGDRRFEGSVRVAATVQYRNRGRAGTAQGQDLARRPDG